MVCFIIAHPEAKPPRGGLASDPYKRRPDPIRALCIFASKEVFSYSSSPCQGEDVPKKVGIGEVLEKKEKLEPVTRS
ncbi:MAG TPA: hypothetical protein PLF30_01720 [Candidatus Moranbacteria bacterium]|nr:hypothetical protein [Candidatus Moranbacteria bacterium]